MTDIGNIDPNDLPGFSDDGEPTDQPVANPDADANATQDQAADSREPSIIDGVVHREDPNQRT